MTKLSIKNATDFLKEHEIDALKPSVLAAHEALHGKTGPGSDFTGWVEWPESYDKEEFGRIEKAAEKIRKQSEVLVVIGIGGSYLGAKAALDFLSCGIKSGFEILFAGNSISSTDLCNLLEYVKDKEFSLNVISKSGTTTEPAIAFRFFRELLEERYGKAGAKERIFATTDKSRGALYKMSREEGYVTFVIPDDIGGRFSVLTPVGLLPIAVSGADIDKIMSGAYDAMVEYNNPDLDNNGCYQYAAVRNALYRKGKTTEILVNYESSLHYVGEWWKQLYGESEGKDGKGIFPASVDFSTDLHSMGQYIQDGLRNVFETVINVENPRKDITIKSLDNNPDGLNFLAGKTVDYVNKQAFLGTLAAHNEGGVPCIVINIDRQDEYCFGHLVYFFEKACGISGYLLGVNPFDQPGVEAYKKNMFALLGKPGYEGEREKLLYKLNN